jgi:inner membrane protein
VREPIGWSYSSADHEHGRPLEDGGPVCELPSPRRERYLDNLTHSLVGATLAELALPAGAPRTMRRTFFVAGVVAANLPDADLVYTWITPPPLGSLLHHRGHTHTVVGLVLLGLAMVAVCLLPIVRDAIRPVRRRLWALIAVALASHLVLDSWNSYGVHPFWPVSSRWFYGDAVFILEPWLWMLLGIVAVMNTANRGGRAFLGAALAGLVAFGTYVGVIPVVATTALVAAALVLAFILDRSSPRARAATSLALSAAFVAALFAAREVARGATLAALEPPERARVVDVVLSPHAANPLCWNVLTLVRDQPGTSYVMTRGDVAVLAPSGCGGGRTSSVEWDAPHTQSLADLRALYRADCWVRGWLQFGRAPHVADGAITDLRYTDTGRRNFTTMALLPPAEAARCPANLTTWRPPRADLLGDAFERAGPASR